MSSRYITALDIGTSKVAAIVGERTATGIKIIGYSEEPVPQDGVRRGEIMNIQKVLGAIRPAMQKVREQVNSLPDTEHYTIRDVYVNISGQNLRCLSAGLHKNRQDPDSLITDEEVASMLDEMYLSKVEPSEKILYVVPQYYNVDEFIGASEAAGMTGKEIEGEYRLFIGNSGSMKKCEQAVGMAGLRPRRFILSSIAAASALLTSDEKELGTVLVDIGAGTTEVLIYQDNIIRHAAVIPFGGNSVSEDIRQICKVSLKNAELMKVQHGSCISEYAPENKIISIKGKDGMTVKDVPFKILHSAIEARMCEILATVRRIVEESGYGDRISSGAVLTGGSVNLNHIQILAKNILKMDVRLGFPDSNTIIGNSIDEVFRPEASVAAGLIIKGFEYEDLSGGFEEAVTDMPAESDPTLFGDHETSSGDTAAREGADQNTRTSKPPKPPKPKKSFSDFLGDIFGPSDNGA